MFESYFVSKFCIRDEQLDDVIAIARRIRDRLERIDTLILNAGVMMTPFSLTHVGVESHFQINYVANKVSFFFKKNITKNQVLVDILMPRLLNSTVGAEWLPSARWRMRGRAKSSPTQS